MEKKDIGFLEELACIEKVIGFVLMLPGVLYAIMLVVKILFDFDFWHYEFELDRFSGYFPNSFHGALENHAEFSILLVGLTLAGAYLFKSGVNIKYQGSQENK